MDIEAICINGTVSIILMFIHIWVLEGSDSDNGSNIGKIYKYREREMKAMPMRHINAKYFFIHVIYTFHTST